MTTCHCAAYAFPHRKYGGECSGDDDCTCYAPLAGPTAQEPPEVRVNANCPTHGRDWGALMDERRDRDDR